jgi:peptidoglycan/xylan/chitin deacetylase (PgdA/CDA1 family)
MKVISPLFRHVLYPGLSKTGYLRRRSEAGPAVLTYHGILPSGYKVIDPCLDGNLVSTDSFRRQLQLLKQQYNVLSPDEFLHRLGGNYDLPPRSVLLTCDDGLQNSLDMLPILHNAGLSCLFFVTGASLAATPTILWYEELYLMFLAFPEVFDLELPEIGVYAKAIGRQEQQRLWHRLVRLLSRFEESERRAFLEKIRLQLRFPGQWNTKYREDPVLQRRFSVLTQPELRQLSDAGMCIGAHTMSHPVLSQCSTELAWSEIFQSKHDLEQALGHKMWALAYPFGDSTSVTSRELQLAEKAGFTCAFLNKSGHFVRSAAFALPRVHITGQMALPEFDAHVSGFHRSMQQLLRPSSAVAIGANA